jgi:flavin reductase (DIM6/NTAB) family NADH-FMN oxidoreductase RutF
VDVRATFNAIVGSLEYPMFIVTARAGDERLGCLVGFATQTSIDLPRFAMGSQRLVAAQLSHGAGAHGDGGPV